MVWSIAFPLEFDGLLMARIGIGRPGVGVVAVATCLRQWACLRFGFWLG